MLFNHWQGKDELHYTWYYDTLYPDMIHDPEDMRYINFPYHSQPVVPDPMTGHYPMDGLKYTAWLEKPRPKTQGGGYID